LRIDDGDWCSYLELYMFTIDSITLTGDEEHQCSIDSVIPRILAGELIIVRKGMQDLELFDQSVDLVINSIEAVCGSEVAAAVKNEGVEKIHLHVGLDQVEAVYAKARVELALKMPAVTAKTFEKLGIAQDFFIHDASLIRLMMPFDIMKSKQKEFKKHLGKLTLHGPHHDHYQNVPINAINTWTAVGRVDSNNGMLIYPDVWGKNLPIENGEVRQDQYLGKPVALDMDPGDILIFHSNHMHASRINSTDDTRVVLTNRICLEKPEYPDAARPQKYFLSSAFPAGIDLATIFSRKGFVGNKRKHLKTGLSKAVHKMATKVGLNFIKYPDETSSLISLEPVDINQLAKTLSDGDIAVIDDKTCATKIEGKVISFGRQCPHQGADLALGFIEGGQVFCPHHGLKLCLKTGEASCSSIKNLKVEVIDI
jgi:nitrite reductase/ring-hydroxylating ferredoxin subunit